MSTWESVDILDRCCHGYSLTPMKFLTGQSQGEQSWGCALTRHLSLYLSQQFTALMCFSSLFWVSVIWHSRPALSSHWTHSASPTWNCGSFLIWPFIISRSQDCPSTHDLLNSLRQVEKMLVVHEASYQQGLRSLKKKISALHNSTMAIFKAGKNGEDMDSPSQNSSGIIT